MIKRGKKKRHVFPSPFQRNDGGRKGLGVEFEAVDWPDNTVNTKTKARREVKLLKYLRP